MADGFGLPEHAPTLREIEDAECEHWRQEVHRLRRQRHDAITVLKHMMLTHSVHGPCEHNSCEPCVAAWREADAFIVGVEQDKE